MQTILITGGTGLTGRALSKYLSAKGYHIIILSRSFHKSQQPALVQYALWDVKNKKIDLSALQSADYIIHLAGAGVMDKKWTDSYKKEIVDSRTESSRLLVDTLKTISHKVKAIVSSSAIGWYGEDKIPGYHFTEEDEADESFLADTCRLWEESIETATAIGIRVCKLRTGIVLSNDGGAFTEFKNPVKMGIAAILGDGRQMISWVHIDDLCGMFLHAIENSSMNGSYNAVSPEPVSNKTLTLKLARLLKGNFYIPIHVPSFLLKFILGQRSIEVLKSTTVSCEKIKKEGFVFIYPDLDKALPDLIK